MNSIVNGSDSGRGDEMKSFITVAVTVASAVVTMHGG